MIPEHSKKKMMKEDKICIAVYIPRKYKFRFCELSEINSTIKKNKIILIEIIEYDFIRMASYQSLSPLIL